mmetsp:Transcript_12212/g.32157  ORF Transcript_12212/g.32157 Transcript_12212/m.32157 type:complete len:391 (-) Transcript_12212:54-1226(-)
MMKAVSATVRVRPAAPPEVLIITSRTLHSGSVLKRTSARWRASSAGMASDAWSTPFASSASLTRRSRRPQLENTTALDPAGRPCSSASSAHTLAPYSALKLEDKLWKAASAEAVAASFAARAAAARCARCASRMASSSLMVSKMSEGLSVLRQMGQGAQPAPAGMISWMQSLQNAWPHEVTARRSGSSKQMGHSPVLPALLLFSAALALAAVVAADAEPPPPAPPPACCCCCCCCAPSLAFWAEASVAAGALPDCAVAAPRPLPRGARAPPRAGLLAADAGLLPTSSPPASTPLSSCCCSCCSCSSSAAFLFAVPVLLRLPPPPPFSPFPFSSPCCCSSCCCLLTELPAARFTPPSPAGPAPPSAPPPLPSSSPTATVQQLALSLSTTSC